MLPSKRSLLVSDIFPPKTGGSGRWFWEVYSRLPREQYVVAAGEDSKQIEFDQTHNLQLVRLPLAMREWGVRSWSGLSGYWGATTRLSKLVRQRHVGMIHCGRVLPEGVMCLALKWQLGVPYLAYVHGEDVTTARDSREHAFLVGRVLGGATRLIANSHNTRRILCEGWHVPESKVQVLHPGVDTSRFVPCAQDAAARASLSWENRTVVLTVGRLQKRKGHDQMIRALQRIKNAVPSVLYAIAGEGEERPALQELVTSEGLQPYVQFLGEIDDRRLIECYQQCDLFILPNRQVGQDIEGFGMVLLEAQACGKPVIAGASGGTAEAMKAPETGLVVPCETSESIAAAVIALLQDVPRREAMGRTARAWVTSNFDWSSLARQAQELFNSLAKQAA